MINALVGANDETKKVLTKCFELDGTSTRENIDDVIDKFKTELKI